MSKVLANCFDILALNPKAGRSRDELEPDIRSHPTGSYIIFYRIVGKQVQIVRVLHAARDIDAIFG